MRCSRNSMVANVNWLIIEKSLYVLFSRHKDFNLFSLSFIDQGDATLTHI